MRVNYLYLSYPHPGLPPRGGPTDKKTALWLFSGRGQVERWPTRQTGSFAKIAHRAIFKRSALPLGSLSRLGGKTGKGVIKKIIFLRQILLLLSCLLIHRATYAQSPDMSWPLFRGNSDLAGCISFEIPSSPALLWSLTTEENTKSSPVVSNNMIFFGTDKGTLYAAGTDGKVKWKHTSDDPVEAPPLVYDNKVMAGSSEGVFMAYNELNGQKVWSYRADNQIVGSANIWQSGNKARIIFGSYDYYLHCIDPSTGKLLWKLETENYVNGTPALTGNKIVFGGCDGMIRVVDPLSGKEQDTADIGVYIAASPALYNGKAYFGDYDGNFYCLDLQTKKITWKVPAGEKSGAILGIPAAGYNYVVIGNEDKYLYCYDAANGKLIWKYRTNGRITGSAVITPSKVVFGSTDGYIYLLNLTDGKKLWSFNTGASVSSSAAVTRDRFYFLTEDGRLLAFGNKN